MGFFAISGLVNALLSLGIGFFVFFNDTRAFLNRIFFLFTFAAGWWSIGYFIWQISVTDTQALFWVRFLMAGAIFIPTIYLHFVLAFLGRRSLFIIISYVFSGFFFIANFTSSFVDRVEPILYFPYWPRPGVLFHPFLVLWIIIVFYTTTILFLASRKESGTRRAQMQYIAAGMGIGFFGGITNYLLWYAIPIPPWGNPLVIFFVIAVAYAVVKHHLMNSRVIVAEFLTIIIVITLLFELFLSQSSIEILLRSIFLALVVLLGYFLVRSVIREVEQREKLQVLSDQLAVANKELSRLDQAKSEFLSIASHQLRTPLTAIKGYSSMLLDGTFGPVGGKVKEGIDKVYASTERMVALVNDLLDTSRLDSGRMVFTFVETDLGEMAKSVCDELMPKGKEKGLAIACTIAPATPKVFVDQMKIRQVLVNFVDNALKYSDTGTVEVKLEIRPHPGPLLEGEGELVFSVHDNGWGMTPEEMGFLFKKFSRGRGETSHIKGTGLGLYVARRLAEAHGGRVWAESPGKGQGSTFFLALKVGWKPPTGDGVYMPKDE